MAASAIEPSSLFTIMSLQSNYRTTCDNCVRSKVRCSKDHPKCHRCRCQGVPCIYSPSRRLKRATDHVDQTQQTNSPARDAADFPSIGASGNIKGPKAATPSRNDNVSSPSVFSSAFDQSYPSPWSFFDNGVDMQKSVVGMDDMEGFEDFEDMEISTQSAAVLTALHDPVMNGTMDPLVHQWSCSNETSSPEAPLSISPKAIPDFFSSPFPSGDNCSNTSTLDTPHGTNSTSESDFIVDGDSRPGCAWIAGSALQTLESPGAPLKDSSMSCSSTEGRLHRNLDTVISTNKAVMKILHRILRCTCSVPGNHLVVISAVLFMVLAWYEACLKACDRACEQSVENAGAGDPGGSVIRRGDVDGCEEETDVLGQTDGFDTGAQDQAELVWIPPIQVGSLELGVESRRQVVAQIVLSELAKVTQLKESLTQHFSGMSSRRASVGGCQESGAQLQFSLRAALQTRIEKISLAAERASK